MAVCGHQTRPQRSGPSPITRRIVASSTDNEDASASMAFRSGYRWNSRSMLLGSPTSIALASVRTEGRGCHCPVPNQSGTTRFALAAMAISRTGKPSRLAQNAPTELPTFPEGTMTPASRSRSRRYASDATA